MAITLHYLEKEEQYQRAYVERILGVTWDRDVIRDMVQNQHKGGKGPDTKSTAPVFIPLSLLLRPELMKELASYAAPSLGSHVPDGAQSMYEDSKDVFLNLLRGVGV